VTFFRSKPAVAQDRHHVSKPRTAAFEPRRLRPSFEPLRQCVRRCRWRILKPGDTV
jgi:hypothetical protein